MIALLCLTLAAAAPSHRRVITSDGIAVALYRYGEPGGPAVLLVPDLGLTRAVFDLQGEGLASHLVAHGHTVYVVELRGQGAARQDGNRYGLAQMVASDLPAVAKVIGEPFDLVAHGYAGTLALAATARELKGRVRKVVAIATPALPEVPSDVARTVLRQGGDFLALTHDPELHRALDLLFIWGGRFRPGRVEALRAHAFGTLGPALSADLLKWLYTGNLVLEDDSTVLGRLQQYDRETLLFDGLLDGYASPEQCVPLKEIAQKADVHLRTFSRFELASEDYSHLSLLLGAGAADEVFEPARKFLEGVR
ncbi:MAG: alpha/beta fold hydrolase [Archangiaceae bacterium]|nr:alpha/beta fold hydrolase [Archangiaceae bacterium]